jgi:hypothetical protein
MTSADNPNPDLSPIPAPALTPALRHAIDAVLLAFPALRHCLADDAVPLDAPLREAVGRYHDNPAVLALWRMCAACEELRKADEAEARRG